VPWPLGVYRGPPEVYRGPCMKITRLKSPIYPTSVCSELHAICPRMDCMYRRYKLRRCQTHHDAC